ncbi:hypothetical protein DV738_g985, partial [Chaetothyriales sp. CBS 135597]
MTTLAEGEAEAEAAASFDDKNERTLFPFLSSVGSLLLQHKEPKLDQQGLGLHNSLLDLPNELILLVATYLDLDGRVLLSLSCRRLRGLLTSSFNMVFGDADQGAKLRFLSCLELDCPEHLTCRSCGLLVRRPRRALAQSGCPHFQYHTPIAQDLSRTRYYQVRDTKSARAGLELVNMVLRTYYYY